MQFVLDQGEVIGCFNCANLDYTRHSDTPDLFSIECRKDSPAMTSLVCCFKTRSSPEGTLFCRHLASSGSPGLTDR